MEKIVDVFFQIWLFCFYPLLILFCINLIYLVLILYTVNAIRLEEDNEAFNIPFFSWFSNANINKLQSIPYEIEKIKDDDLRCLRKHQRFITKIIFILIGISSLVWLGMLITTLRINGKI